MITIRPGVFVPTYDYWLFRDSYNQIWKLRVSSSPDAPFIIELHEKLTEEINPMEKILRTKL